METLESLLKNFYLISGMNMTIFDTQMHVIASYPKRKCKFCTILEKSDQAKQQCHQCDLHAMEYAFKTQQLHIYTCWCGLYETIIPLYTYGQLSGYFMMGQTLNSDEDRENVLQKAGKCIKDRVLLETSLKFSSVHTKQQIEAFAEIVNICAQYLTLTNTLQIDSENLAEEIQKYLLLHHKENITIEMLCTYFHVSKATLHTHFQDVFHTTVHQRLLSIRLNQARNLCLTTDKSIKVIAKECGFKDPNYFSKVYKKYFGILPTETKRR